MNRQLFGREKTHLVLGAVAFLVLLGILGLTTDLFRSPRSILREAVEQSLAPQKRNVDLTFTIEPEESRPAAQRLSFHAEGVITDAMGTYPTLEGTGSVRIRQKGVELIFDMAARAVNGGVYLVFKELPVLRGAGEKLEGVWIRLADPKEGSPQELSRADRSRFARAFLTSKSIERIETKGRERVGEQSGRTYIVHLRKDVARALLKHVADQNIHAGLRGSARWSAGILERFDPETIALTIAPRTHNLLKAHIVLLPLQEGLKGTRLVMTITFTQSADAPGAVEIPKSSQRLSRPELLLGLFGFRL